jgi:hypothetical protein
MGKYIDDYVLLSFLLDEPLRSYISTIYVSNFSSMLS